jgi:large subunit ribosomal protein L3
MKFILGTKLGMTQVWQEENKRGVTKIQVGPCKVVQVKTADNDGYEAVQLGFGDRKLKHTRKPQQGHTKGLGNFRYLREFRLDRHNSEKKPELKAGDVIDASTFTPGDIVAVTAFSKGRGFAGVVKRHGFRGQKETHGTKDQVRMPGSAGATGPAHVFKGMRMPGQMGNKRITTQNIKVVEVDLENNIIMINGSVPGAANGLVMITAKGELKIAEAKQETVVEPVVEETKEEKTAEPVEETKIEEVSEVVNEEVKAEETKVEEKIEEVKVETPVEENIKEEAVEEKAEEQTAESVEEKIEEETKQA